MCSSDLAAQKEGASFPERAQEMAAKLEVKREGDVEMAEAVSEEELLAKLRETDLRHVSKLLFDGRLPGVLARMEEMERRERDVAAGAVLEKKRAGTLEQSSEYQLILSANELLAEVREEILAVHQLARRLYHEKFAELETLVLNPLDYARVVLRMANRTDISGLELDDLLQGPTVMVVKMASTASATAQRQVSEEKMEKALEACRGMLELDAARGKMLAFIEARMTVIAPNLSAIVGTDTAAKLVGLAGGLLALSRIHAGTVQMLGAKRNELQGFSLQSTVKHVGFIYNCQLVQSCPEAHRTKAIRVVACKATLAARIDGYGQAPDGSQGLKIRKEIEGKIEKWQEPPPARKVKALAAPDDQVRSTRGGKFARKKKQRSQVTEVRKLQQRLAMDSAEDTYGNEEVGLGSLNQSNRLRLQIVEDKRLKKLAKKYQLDGPTAGKGRRKEIRGGATTSGLASSLAFTPVQGIELVDPELMKKKVEQANRTYFSHSAAFSRVKKETAAKQEDDPMQ